MPNPDNIKVKRSPSELRKNGRKGGIASGIARRRKKTMRELLDIAMDEVVKNNKNGESKTNAEWVTAALVHKARQGDVSAYKTICDMLGEGAPLKIDANVKQQATTQISFADMDVEAMAVFLKDVKEQAQREKEEQADE